MAAISGRDFTLHHTEAMEAISTARQRVLCARNVINFAAKVPKRDHLPVLLSALSSPVQQLRFEAAASLHVLSRLHVGTLSLLQARLSRSSAGFCLNSSAHIAPT
jgi:hypothetical protein